MPHPAPAVPRTTSAPLVPPAPAGVRPGWTLLSNHGHVLLAIAADSSVRFRDLAERVGITERAAQRIVAELEEAGYVSHERDGRRNIYLVDGSRPLRHPLEAHQQVATLLRLVER